ASPEVRTALERLRAVAPAPTPLTVTLTPELAAAAPIDRGAAFEVLSDEAAVEVRADGSATRHVRRFVRVQRVPDDPDARTVAIAYDPSRELVSVLEAGVEFIRNLATDVIGQKDGPKYVPLLGSFFFLILTSNMLGLIPGGKSIGGTIGGTTALALISWLVFVWVGFKKNGFYGYFRSLIPSGVREMPLAGRIGLGGFIFLLEFVSTFLVRPLTLAVRLFANMYAGHVILGVFSAFVLLFIPVTIEQLSLSVGGVAVGLVSFTFLVLMYAFEVFVAFIQAYVFTILTAVYIQMSVHASDH
ncbi:MAG: ATP synthase F0 subunit A, partial [Actinobacteria bacterium HGW-Actinobacteria-8]